MGLYLCVFDGDEEVEGVEIGSYADFGRLRTAVVTHLEGGRLGSRYPVLQLHPDSDGEWTVAESAVLEGELLDIGVRFRALPAEPFASDWQKEVARSLGLHPSNLFDTFIDVDGEPLLDRMVELCRIAQQRRLPILFQ